MLTMIRVPTMREVKELVDGKPRRNRRSILKDIALARQQKIQLEYML